MSHAQYPDPTATWLWLHDQFNRALTAGVTADPRVLLCTPMNVVPPRDRPLWRFLQALRTAAIEAGRAAARKVLNPDPCETPTR
jgi:hypothetical protein